MEFPNRPFITVDNGLFAIGNRHIVRVFSVSDKQTFRTEYIRNRRIEGGLDLVFQPCSEEFVLRVYTAKKKIAALKCSALRVADILTNEEGDTKRLEVRFAPLHALGIGYAVTLTYEITGDKPYMYKTLRFSSTDDDVRVDTIDTELISLPREMEQKWSRPNMKKAFLQPYHAALGQPIYLNGLFTGSEFPATDNNIEDGYAHVRYYSGKSFYDLAGGKTEYTTWKTVFGAARSTQPEVVRADFLSYIDDIARPVDLRVQYNSWFDHMLDVDRDNIRHSFMEIEKGLTQNGVPPVDSYVVDDGWVDYDKDFWGFNEKFPNELYEGAALAESFGSHFGLWLGPRGGYNSKTPGFGKRMQRAGKGGYNRRSRDVCTADHRYHKNITALFLDYMERFDINYWKLDGFMLKPCRSKHHGHPTGGYEGMYAFTDHWENWIRIFQTMRAARAEKGKALWLNQTSYSNASPWHLQFCESLWMQNSDDVGFLDKTDSGEPMGGADYDRMLSYRDAKYFDFHKTRAYQFPAAHMYNHDPIYGNTAKVQMTDGEFRKYLYMLASRGTAFWELYYSYNLFSPEKWQINADVLRFLREKFHILRHAQLIGESPKTGSVYGYSAWDGEEGIVTLRNPLNRVQSFSVTLDRQIGVGEEARDMACVVWLPYSPEPMKRVWQYGDTVQVELQPHAVRLLCFGKPETTAPVLRRARMTDQNTVRLTFDKRIVLYAQSIAVNGEVCEARLLSDYSEAEVQLGTPAAEGETLTVSYSVSDVWGNQAQADCAVTWYPDGKLPGVFSGEGDFTLHMRLENAPRDGVLLTLGQGFTVTVSNGCPVAECMGVKAKAHDAVHERRFARLDVVREPNGVLKIYVDGALSGGAYDPQHKAEALPAATLQAHESVKEYVFFDHARPFDALR